MRLGSFARIIAFQRGMGSRTAATPLAAGERRRRRVLAVRRSPMSERSVVLAFRGSSAFVLAAPPLESARPDGLYGLASRGPRPRLLPAERAGEQPRGEVVTRRRECQAAKLERSGGGSVAAVPEAVDGGALAALELELRRHADARRSCTRSSTSGRWSPRHRAGARPLPRRRRAHAGALARVVARGLPYAREVELVGATTSASPRPGRGARRGRASSVTGRPAAPVRDGCLRPSASPLVRSTEARRRSSATAAAGAAHAARPLVERELARHRACNPSRCGGRSRGRRDGAR